MARFWWSAKGAMNVGNPELAFEIAELRNASLQARRDQPPRRRSSPSRRWSIPGPAWPATRRPDRCVQSALAGKIEEGREAIPGLFRFWAGSCISVCVSAQESDCPQAGCSPIVLFMPMAGARRVVAAESAGLILGVWTGLTVAFCSVFFYERES